MYKGDVAKLANRNKDRAAKDASAEWKAVIILVPMRLGGESFNPAYMDCIKVTVQWGELMQDFGTPRNIWAPPGCNLCWCLILFFC